MLSVQTLLSATDGSAGAERARPVAERLAAETGADLHILQVESVPLLAHVEFRAVPTFDTVGLTEADVAADLHRPPPETPPPECAHVAGTAEDAGSVPIPSAAFVRATDAPASASSPVRARMASMVSGVTMAWLSTM